MHYLITVIIGIALSAALATASINYSPIASMKLHANYQKAQSGLERLERAVYNYLDNTRDAVSGDLVYPGDGINLVPLIVPNYGFVPAPIPGEFAWTVSSGQYQGLAAIGICMVPAKLPTNEMTKMLNLLAARLPAGSATRGSNCNSAADDPGGSHLTYWVVLNHLE